MEGELWLVNLPDTQINIGQVLIVSPDCAPVHGESMTVLRSTFYWIFFYIFSHKVNFLSFH